MSSLRHAEAKAVPYVVLPTTPTYREYYEFGTSSVNIWTPAKGFSQAEIAAHSHFGGWVDEITDEQFKAQLFQWSRDN